MAKRSPPAQRRQQAAAAATPPDRTVSAHVFLESAPEAGPAEALEAEAERRLREAAERAQAAPGAARIRKVHPLARSFSVEAAPEVVEALGKAPGVRAVLPNEQPDLLIRPVRKKREK